MPLETDNMQLAVPITTVGGQYYVKAQCQASGKTFYLTGYVEVEGADITLGLADTDYNAGDGVSITLANSGPVDTTGVCSIDLTDGFQDTVYSESGTVKNVSAGGSVPLPFTIPAWATGGLYRLEAECVDSLNSKVASLVTYLDVTGVAATLTSVTDRETYSTSDNIDVQTQIINSTLPLSGTLHLWMWEAVKSESVLTRLWAKHEGGTGTDTPGAITVDADGNVYVTGARHNGTDTDYGTVKYSPEGIKQWEATYAGGGGESEGASAITVDASGNVYVTGTSREMKQFSLTDRKDTCTTVKYNAAGAQQWVNKFHGTANSYDHGLAIAVDGSSVYVAGQSASTGTFGDYLTIKYNAGTGVQEWASTYSGSGGYLDSATGMALDGTGNVYVAGYAYVSDNGTSNTRLTTIKYNSGGTQQWVSHSEYPAGGMFTPAYIAFSSVDASVLVAGSVSLGAGADFGVIKYDTIDGSQEWTRYYDGPVNGADTVVGLAVDSGGNAIITGSVTVAASGGELFDVDLAVRKYDAAGTLKWAVSYGGDAWTNEVPAGVAVDADGDAYVAASSSYWDGWATLKYDGESGDQEWITTYSGLDDGQEYAKGIALGNRRHTRDRHERR